MSFTIKYDDITSFQYASISQISTWSDSIEEIFNNLDAFSKMDSFQGYSADSIKSYISDMHSLMIASASEILTEFQNKYLLYNDGFYKSVDDDIHSLITEDSLTELKNSLFQSYGDFEDEVELANLSSGKIQDLVQGLPTPTLVESGYETANSRLQSIVNKTSEYESYHLQNDFSNLRELLSAFTTFCNERLTESDSVLKNYVAGSIAGSSSYQTLGATVQDNYNKRKEMKAEIEEAANNEKLRFDLLKTEWAEERKKNGIRNAILGVVTIGVGAICIVGSFGAATPLVVTVGGSIFGSLVLAGGVASVVEAGQDIYYGSVGNISSVAWNPIRDTVFSGNQPVYNIFLTASTIGASFFTMLGGAYGVIDSSKAMLGPSQAANMTRGITVYAGKIGISAASFYASQTIGKNAALQFGMSQGDAELAGLLAGAVGAGITAGALENYDRNNNISGYYRPQNTFPLSYYESDNLLDKNLLDELSKSGVKYTPENVVMITKTPDGKLVWLESGKEGQGGSGLAHIIEGHGEQFSNKGISSEQLPDFLKYSLENGNVVGSQGRAPGRPIYQVVYNGSTYNVAITVSDNGFIVGANLTSI